MNTQSQVGHPKVCRMGGAKRNPSIAGAPARMFPNDSRKPTAKEIVSATGRQLGVKWDTLKFLSFKLLVGDPYGFSL
jgi:hypothetical protein